MPVKLSNIFLNVVQKDLSVMKMLVIPKTNVFHTIAYVYKYEKHFPKM